MALVFYDFTAAPSPRRARIFIAEKGIEVENVQVDLGSGAQLNPEFRAINPLCTVPALQTEDGLVLCDNAGIAAYLEAIRPEPPLLGTTPAEKGLVASWNSQIEQGGLSAVAEVLRNTASRMKDRAMTGPHNYEQIPALAERGALRLGHFFDRLNEQLAGRQFIAIDSYSVADISALVLVDFAKWVKIEPQDHHTDLKRWHADVSARPSASA